MLFLFFLAFAFFLKQLRFEAYAFTGKDLWFHHKKLYNLTFIQSEDSQRAKIFFDNLKFIHEHNKHSNMHGYTLKMNHLGHYVISNSVYIYPFILENWRVDHWS